MNIFYQSHTLQKTQSSQTKLPSINQNPDSTLDLNGNNIQNSSGYQSRTVWLAKKQKFEVDKDIEKITTRINLLKDEENKLMKRIQETKKRTIDLVDIKRQYYQKLQQRHKKQNNQEELKEKWESNAFNRKQQAIEKQNIREAILELRKSEQNYIKQLSQENDLKIKKNREKLLEQKKQKHNQVQQMCYQSKENIIDFWQRKYNKFSEDQLNYIKQLDQQKYIKENEMSKLESVEIDLINKLERSQITHNQVLKDYKNVQNQPLYKYLQDKTQNNFQKSQNSLYQEELEEDQQEIERLKDICLEVGEIQEETYKRLLEKQNEYKKKQQLIDQKKRLLMKNKISQSMSKLNLQEYTDVTDQNYQLDLLNNLNVDAENKKTQKTSENKKNNKKNKINSNNSNNNNISDNQQDQVQMLNIQENQIATNENLDQENNNGKTDIENDKNNSNQSRNNINGDQNENSNNISNNNIIKDQEQQFIITNKVNEEGNNEQILVEQQNHEDQNELGQDRDIKQWE